jgi:hypothetical protein
MRFNWLKSCAGALLAVAVGWPGISLAGPTYDYVGQTLGWRSGEPALLPTPNSIIVASVTFGDAVVTGFSGTVTSGSILSTALSAYGRTAAIIYAGTTETFTFVGGEITAWDLTVVSSLPPGIGDVALTSSTHQDTYALLSDSIGNSAVLAQAFAGGTWTLREVDVPEPASALLLATAFGAVARASRSGGKRLRAD